MSEWSTDGRSLAVLSGGALSIFDIATGAQRILYTATDEDRATLARGLAVSSDAVFVGARNIIVKLALAGGSPVPFTTLDRSRHAWHGFPRVLPDGRVIFIARRSNAAAAETLVASRDGEIIGRLELPATALRVAIDPAGAVIYAQGSSLVAQAVDWSTLRLAGRPATIANDAIIDPGTGAISASVSAGGVLAYRVAALARVQFEWMDRSGRPLGVIGPADTFTNFDLSPNGNTIAVTRREQTQNWLWTIDVARAVAAPADTTQTAPPSDPTWSPDGQSLAIRRGNTLVVRPAFGGAERVITKWQAYPDSWSRDGKYLAVGRPMPGGNYELWAVRADGAAVEELPLVTGVSLADEARFSPDGRWLAFHAGTERADTTQVFVIPFPPTGERWQLSANGGMQPRWRADGRELLFLSPDGRMMSVAMPNGDPRRAAAPVPLFRTAFEVSASNDQFTIAADGRILVRRPVSGPGTDQAPVAVLVNWRKIVGLE